MNKFALKPMKEPEITFSPTKITCMLHRSFRDFATLRISFEMTLAS